MFKHANPLFLICETPLHAGSGDDLGIVDLPIQRERHTSFPKIEGSSLKGAIREVFENKLGRSSAQIKSAFGPEATGSSGFAGALGFSDARLLLFPVKSMKGVFAWVTCPKVLNQFKRDMELSGIVFPNEIIAPEYSTCTGSNLFIKNGSDKVVLEEYTYSISKQSNTECNALATWLKTNVFSNSLSYWQDKVGKDIIVLPDDEFKDFVNLSTEVITRIAINNETGTVKDTGLFTEEYLPSESLMYSLIMSSDDHSPKVSGKSTFADANAITTFFKNTHDTNLKSVFQIGGSATLGKGIVRSNFIVNPPISKKQEQNEQTTDKN